MMCLELRMYEGKHNDDYDVMYLITTNTPNSFDQEELQPKD